MISFFKFALIVAKILQATIRYMEKQGIIKDEQRRELLRQMQVAADGIVMRDKIELEVKKLNDKEIDNALAGDFRD